MVKAVFRAWDVDQGELFPPALFVQVLALCRDAGMVKLGHVELDGTKIRANTSKQALYLDLLLLRLRLGLQSRLGPMLATARTTSSWTSSSTSYLAVLRTASRISATSTSRSPSRRDWTSPGWGSGAGIAGGGADGGDATRTLLHGGSPCGSPETSKPSSTKGLSPRSNLSLEVAAALEQSAVEGLGRILLPDHPQLRRLRLNLARTWIRQAAILDAGDLRGAMLDRSLQTVSAVCESEIHAASAVALEGSIRQAEERASRSQEALGAILSFAEGYDVFTPSVALRRAGFVLSETSRGAGLAAARIVREAAGIGRYSELRMELREAVHELAAITLGPTPPTSERYHELRTRREAVERELMELARSLAGGELDALVLDIEELARRLGSGRAFVGFRRVPIESLIEGASESGFASARGSSVDELVAFVLQGASVEQELELELIRLGPVEPIESAIRRWRRAMGTTAPEHLSSPEEEHRGVGLADPGVELEPQVGMKLRELVWDPLLTKLEGIDHIVLALDDVLNLIPFDALPLDASSVVGDRWRIEIRTAPWELLVEPRSSAGGRTLVALGGAEFDSHPLGLEEMDSGASDGIAGGIAQGEPVLLRGGPWADGFRQLVHTGPEAHGIAALFREVEGSLGRALVLERAFASRGALEEAASGARWLHVAAHGWFASGTLRSWDDDDGGSAKSARLWARAHPEDVVRGMSPMLLCGLAFAGANLPLDALGRVPGLMTAEELSTLDLTGCELAVLSACDTNVGERRAGQGVASLQKALHMAGARSVITSLWKVPDEATYELMLDLYRRLWVEKKPKHQALWEAKLRLREAKDECGNPLYSTRDWAAWVLTGDPR